MDTGTIGSLVWLLLWGALFYFMMSKGGCGMHAGGHHGHGGARPARPDDERRHDHAP